VAGTFIEPEEQAGALPQFGSCVQLLGPYKMRAESTCMRLDVRFKAS